MRIVFCGTADFAVPSLHALVGAHEVLAVVTQPDRAGSRGRPAARPVSAAASLLGLRVLRPERVRAAETVAEILDLSPDVLVVAAYGQIIPASLLEGPRLGGVNVHGSLLPRWRGAAPVAASILAGDQATGVSIMRMEVGLDTGPVYAAREIAITSRDTTPLLTDRLAAHGASLLLDVLDGVGAGALDAVPQDESMATYAPRLAREDGSVDWATVTAVEVGRLVRALQPWPGTSAPLGGQTVRLLAGEVGESGQAPGAPGQVVATVGEGVDVATTAGTYRVGFVQPPGGRPMSAAAYLRGRRTEA
ncbi:MAG: methionyl-tRNA formyltransferase [Candidatus Dormibacteraeota bacterium]|uniref:Methionyl-tRNA formyltransferase n=1 Tax=Candidatus Amunia macphersoniae TaxID=3127014 RepID=A0A934KLW9_9BACT|nr:methionyl-tRNA formyltransferase [Candidatus Dormibacteraeota bacterium]